MNVISNAYAFSIIKNRYNFVITKNRYLFNIIKTIGVSPVDNPYALVFPNNNLVRNLLAHVLEVKRPDNMMFFDGTIRVQFADNAFVIEII